MTSDNLEVKPTHKESVTSVFEWMPVCALVIDTNGIIQEINQKAIQFFKASTKEDFIFDKENIINMIVDAQRALDLIKLFRKSSEPISKEILLRLFDKSIVSVDLHACQFPSDPNYILLQFTEKTPHNQVYLYELSQAFRRDVQRLKPYLNKPGKIILEEVISNSTVEGIEASKSTKNNQIVVLGESRMSQLTNTFPEFSNKELIFCGYLSLKISINEIAILTNKTPNSLRVSFHRMLQKTDFSSSKEFIRVLEAIL